MEHFLIIFLMLFFHFINFSALGISGFRPISTECVWRVGRGTGDGGGKYVLRVTRGLYIYKSK